MTNEKISGLSQNIAWTTQKGSWIIHFLVTLSFMMLFAVLFNWNLSIQLSVICYNSITFFFLHYLVGDPFDNKYNCLTFWEQMAEQLESSESMGFMLGYPCVMFFVANWLVVWNEILFYAAVFSLCIVVIPKLGFMHRKRIFGIRDFS